MRGSEISRIKLPTNISVLLVGFGTYFVEFRNIINRSNFIKEDFLPY